MLKPESIPGELIKLLLVKIITPLVDDRIINEYKSVLKRNKFSFNIERVELLMDFLKNNAIYINKETTSEFFIDKDKLILQCK